MDVTQARIYEEVEYLAVIFIVSLSFSLPRTNANIFFLLPNLDWLDPLLETASILPFFLFAPLYFSIAILVPVLPHLPAFLYGMQTQDNRISEGMGMPRQKDSYRLALLISILLSLFVTNHWYIIRGRTSLALSIVIIVVATLFIPALQAYYEYKDHGIVREVVVIVLIYAPWVQFVRIWVVYTSSEVIQA